MGNAYKNSLKLALENNIKTIAFPSISTGVYGYPIEKASKIAIMTVKDFVKNTYEISKVQFVLFSEADFKTYELSLKEIF